MREGDYVRLLRRSAWKPSATIPDLPPEGALGVVRAVGKHGDGRQTGLVNIEFIGGPTIKGLFADRFEVIGPLGLLAIQHGAAA